MPQNGSSLPAAEADSSSSVVVVPTATTVLAVEQNASVLDHVDHVYVLDQGRLRLGGPVADIGERVRSEIADAYLGDEKKGEQTNV